MYGSVEDMVARFGETEIIRLSQIEDRETDTINRDKVETALRDAASIIDTFLVDRYALPLAKPPVAIIRAACMIARYDLSKSGRSDPTEQMQKDYDEIMKWLKSISKGEAILDAPKPGPVFTGNEMMVDDRPPMFHTGRLWR